MLKTLNKQMYVEGFKFNLNEYACPTSYKKKPPKK